MAETFFCVHVLLVEDDPGDELLVSAALREAATPVDLAVVSDGAEALTYLRRQGAYAHAVYPDLVLLDLKLPKKSGLEVLEEMKNDPGLRRTPVIILTTSFTPQDIIKAYDLQASAYLTKPEALADYERVVIALREYCLGVMRFPPRQEPVKSQPGLG